MIINNVVKIEAERFIWLHQFLCIKVYEIRVGKWPESATSYYSKLKIY